MPTDGKYDEEFRGWLVEIISDQQADEGRRVAEKAIRKPDWRFRDCEIVADIQLYKKMRIIKMQK